MTIGQNTLDGKRLLVFVERVEAEEKAKKTAVDAIAVIKAEAKVEGFSPKGIQLLVKARKLKPSEFREAEDLRDVYLHAAGFAGEPPLFKYFDSITRDGLGKAEVIERMTALVPPGGAITVEVGGDAPMRITRDKDGNTAVEEVAPSESAASPAAPAPAPAPVPDVDPAGAETLGREAARDNKPIIDNPFPFGDARRPRWDEGWRKETGTDGMGPDDDDED